MLFVCDLTLFFNLESSPRRVEEDRHRIYWNDLWKLQERSNFPFKFMTDDVQLSSPNSGNCSIDTSVQNFQVLHRVVILIFC